MSVMFLEILGTRIIGPFYGVSLFVWCSLISVTLVALAAGYYIGGIIADKDGNAIPVYLITATAGTFIAIIPVIKEAILTLTNPLGLRMGSLTCSFLLFFIPLTLLGMVGPCIIKLNASRLEKVGLTSGSVFAISTMGSFIGTIALGFFLLPVIGTQNIIYILSGILFILSLNLIIRDIFFVRQKVDASSIIIIIILFLSIIISFGFKKITHSNTTADFNVIYSKESLYGKVKVVDDHRWNVRWLMSDSSAIGGQFLKSSLPIFPLIYILESIRHFNPDANNALLIGLGAGHLPMAMKKHNIVTDVIEIDPEVALAAQKHFNFTPTGKLIVGDARSEIRNLKKKYDFIIHDTFTGGAVPSHLLSVEMLNTLKSLLNNKGIFALAYFGFSEGEKAVAAASVYKTIKSLFPFTKVYVSKEDTDPVDIIFFASMEPLNLQTQQNYKHMNPIAAKVLHNMKDLEKDIPMDIGFLITDDFNPLDSLQEKKAEAYRDNMISLIGRKMLLK